MPSSDNQELAFRSFKAASLVIVIQFVKQFVQLFLGIVLARLLSPDDFGIIGLLTVLWAVSNVFIDGGFGQALLQRKEISETDLSSVFYYNISLSFFLCFVIISMSSWIADFYHQPILRQTVQVSAWTLPLGALGSIQRVLLGRDLKQGIVTATSLYSGIIGGIVAVFLGWRGYGVWALVWQMFITTALGSFFLFLFVRWFPKAPFSWKALKSLFRFGSNLMISGVLEAFLNNVHNVVIGKFYSPVILGYYEQARRYSVLWPSSIQGSISSVLFPAFSKIQDDLPRLRKAFQRALEVSFFAIIFPSFLLCTLSRPFIELVLSPKWLPCIPYWWLLTCVVIFWPIHNLNLQLLNAIGRSDLFLMLGLVKKIMLIGSVLILIFWGLIPMLCYELFYNIASAYLNCYYVGKFIDFGFRKQLKCLSLYVIFSIIACIGSWLFYLVISPLFNWGAFIGATIFGSSIFLILNIVFKSPAFKEIVKLINQKLKTRDNKDLDLA